MMDSLKQGSLLSLGDYYGSLAATRSLGSFGVPIYFADHRSLTPGGSSKYVTQNLSAPSPEDFIAYGDWLEDYGRRHPGFFLYPTSDDMAYIIASRAKALSPFYTLYQPSLDTIMGLLDKSRLSLEASQVGLRMPKTFSGSSTADLLETSRSFDGPLLIKPKTQVGLLTKGKGIFCTTRAQVAEGLTRFEEHEIFGSEILNYDPTLRLPILQAYHQSAVAGMLSIAGFVSRDFKHFFCLASEKVFQRPRRLGVGIGFSACPVPGDLQQRLFKLCERISYFGVFEAEFVKDETTGEHLLVDFNPRYYGQMAFEIARGLNLPKLAYLDATGDFQGFEKEMEVTRLALSRPTAISSNYSLSWVLSLMVRTQRLGGQMPRNEYKKWINWLNSHNPEMFDAIASQDDPKPKEVDQYLFLKKSLRHPRDFYRKFFT